MRPSIRVRKQTQTLISKQPCETAKDTNKPQHRDHIKPNTMSNQQSSSTSYSSVSYSSTTSTSSNGGPPQVSGERHAQTSQTDASGTKVSTASQILGEPAVTETRTYDQEGRNLIDGATREGVGMGRRIEDISGEQQERDRMYNERIEEEYAKREGGA